MDWFRAQIHTALLESEVDESWRQGTIKDARNNPQSIWKRVDMKTKSASKLNYSLADMVNSQSPLSGIHSNSPSLGASSPEFRLFQYSSLLGFIWFA
jgi:hypothetical protein